MADPLLNLNLDFWYNALFAFIDICFAIMLWTVDRRGKKRQDVSMKRQDESIDVILEQISKVNQFQTRTLSYAIETLENDIAEIRKIVVTETGAGTVTAVPVAVTGEAGGIVPVGDVTPPVSRFGTILREQITGMVDSIKKNLTEIKNAGEQESYKVKKGLEFDLKHMLRGLSDLENIKVPEREPAVVSGDKPMSPVEDEVEVLEQEYKPVAKEIRSTFKTEEPADAKGYFSRLENEVDNLSSIEDLEFFASSILDSVGKKLQMDLGKGIKVDFPGISKKTDEERRLRKEKAREKIERRLKKLEERGKERKGTADRKEE